MKLISVPKAAERIGCSKNHLYNLVAAGKLTRYNVGLTGTATRVSEEDVDRFIAESARPVRSVDEAS